MQTFSGTYKSNSSGKSGHVNLNIENNTLNFMFFFYETVTFTLEKQKRKEDYLIELYQDRIYIIIKEYDTYYNGEYRFYNKEEYGTYIIYKINNKNKCLII